MSTLSKQSIIPAATDLSQSASSSSPQLLSSLDSDTPNPTGQRATSAFPVSEEDSIAALMTTDISAIEKQQKALQLLAEHTAVCSGELSSAIPIITRAATRILCVDRVSLWLVSDDEQFEQVASYSSIDQTYTSGTSLSASECSFYLETLSDRASFSTENVAKAQLKDNSWIRYFAQRGLLFDAPGALFSVPLRAQGKVIGALWCEHAQSHRWCDLESATAFSIALIAAAAIEAKEQRLLTETLNSHRRQLRRETIEREQAEQAWQESQRFIQGIIDASTNILYVDSFDDGSNFYISRWIKNVLGYEIHEVQKLGPHYLEQLVHADQKQQMAAERRKLAAINDGEVVENEYQFRHRQGNWRWLLCRETVFQRDSNGQPTQVFGTATDITKRKHAEDALKEFNKELTRLARMDGLTQVANRRAFDQYLQKEWNNVGTGHSSLSLILCDIDYFKNFNDTYGHQAGDVCLRQVAEAIERAVKRSTDLVARYGGEEFAIILPNTTVTGLIQVAAEIQKEIQALAIPHSCSAVSEYITLSLGLSVVSSTENIHPGMLVAAADQGLYQAKYEGRDRFCLSKIESEA